jgi:phage head maturation protease
MDGSEAEPKMRLTIEDNWYEFTLANGRVVLVRVKRGDDGSFPAGFLAARNKMKSGDEDVKRLFKQKYNEAIATIGAVPFARMTVSEGGAAK